MFELFTSGWFYFWLLMGGTVGFVVGSMWASFFQSNDYYDALAEIEALQIRVAEMESKQ